MDSFTLHSASPKDVERVLEWADSEGWNPGRFDARCFFAADPSGFHIGEYQGRMVSAISAVKYESHFGFVGLYIVHPEFRGRGFGLATWKHALDSLHARNLGLDGVLEQERNYAKMGFSSAHRTLRHRIDGQSANGRLPLPIPSEAFSAIEAFDRRYFPARRTEFLRAWLTQSNAVSLYEESAGSVRAYGVMRSCREGWKIGPLFAEMPAAAERVLDKLLKHTRSQPAFLDVPTNNPEAIALARRAGMTPVFETIRMYTRGSPADVDPTGVYGVTSLELG